MAGSGLNLLGPAPSVLSATLLRSPWNDSSVPSDAQKRIVQQLLSRGYNADREAIALLASAPDPDRAIDQAIVETSDDALKLTAAQVRSALDVDRTDSGADRAGTTHDPVDGGDADSIVGGDSDLDDGGDADGTIGGNSSTQPSESDRNPSISTGTEREHPDTVGQSPVEIEGSRTPSDTTLRSLQIAGDVTDRSTGTGAYEDFVTLFRDRYERLRGMLSSRVSHRSASSLEAATGGGDAGMIGMINDVRSTANGHWLIELEDPTGVFPALVLSDREIADLVNELVLDEVIGVIGTLSSDGGIIFVDEIYFPDVPRTFQPTTADRHVQAALISDVHVGSQEFMADTWHEFAHWLHTDEAAPVEYVLIAGDMVEGVGVYPDQDEELDIVDLYDQYEQFAEHLTELPGDLEIVMIPGNHDAVRLAEPQPAFDEELRGIMSAHDATITGNPSTVTIEGVSVLMYHGVSLYELITELPAEKASFDDPHTAMYHLLKKRHLAPQYGGHMRLAPEERDYLVIEEVPDVFHTGHLHKLGVGRYHNVVAINSGCWQAQTSYQKSNNIDPDVGYAPILDLDTLDVTIRKFT